MNEVTSQKLAELSGKIGVALPILVSEYERFMLNVKSIYPDKDAVWQEERARHLVYAKHTEALRSPSIPLDIVVFYAAEALDYNRSIRDLALESFKINPTQAISSGLVFPDGTPRDHREWLTVPAEGVKGRKNPNFNKPLQPFEQKRILGFATRYGETKTKLLSATLRDEACKAEVPLNKPLTVRFNIRGEDEHHIYATSGRRTVFTQESTNPVFAGWSTEKSNNLLVNAPFKTKPTEIEAWYDRNKANKQHVIVVEADLVGKAEEPTERGSYYLRLGNIEDFDSAPVTCFVDDLEYEKIRGLGTGTKLIATGGITLGTDLMTQTRTSLILNAFLLNVVMPVKAEELNVEMLKEG